MLRDVSKVFINSERTQRLKHGFETVSGRAAALVQTGKDNGVKRVSGQTLELEVQHLALSCCQNYHGEPQNLFGSPGPTSLLFAPPSKRTVGVHCVHHLSLSWKQQKDVQRNIFQGCASENNAFACEQELTSPFSVFTSIKKDKLLTRSRQGANIFSVFFETLRSFV